MAKDFSKCQLPKKSSDLFFNVSRESSKRHRAHSETSVKFLLFTDSGLDLDDFLVARDTADGPEHVLVYNAVEPTMMQQGAKTDSVCKPSDFVR